MKQLFFFIQIIVLTCIQYLYAQTKADTIHVSHYDINLEIRNFAQQEIKGYTDISIVAKIAPLSSINLHFLALTVDSVKKEDNLIDFFHQGQNLNIILPFSSVNDTAIIRVYYQGRPVRDPQWGGFYFTSDFAYNMGVGMGSRPHSFGRVWFPCIDEFTDKSTYTFNITTDLDKKAICGGMLVDSVNLGDAMRWKWELTDPISTYLASVAVGNYQVYRDTVRSISGNMLPIEIYATPDVMPRVPGSFVNLKMFIHTFEQRWGACRWQRVGYVVVPFNSGAMEHATNIAYPRSSVTGTTANQSLISHELAHSWFGNLITCSTSQNMWINEGFARYGEYLCDEILDPSLQTYKTGIRSLHMRVLRRAHIEDGGYYALDNVPPNVTYGTTTYDKGGLVAYTLRHYMGDELYFSSIKQFLYENKYENVDSEEFFDKLSQISGINLHDFFLGWVHQPGFLNFNIDSIKSKAGSNNVYNIAFKQRLHHAHHFANKNRVDVEFVSVSGERYLVERIQFSGEHEIVEVQLPFEPVFWAIDPNFKMGDFCYDYTQSINNMGTTTISDAYFRTEITQVTDESILRIEYNPFAPTPPKNDRPNIFKISDKYFWRVGFLKYNTMQARYAFTFDHGTINDLLQGGYSVNDLVLLYRKDAAHDWKTLPATVTGNISSGRLTIDFILPGEYTLGIGYYVGVKEWENEVLVYPNPATGELRITNCELRVESVEIYDITGKMMDNPHFVRNDAIPNGAQRNEGWHAINIVHLSPGIYHLKITFTNKKSIIKKFVKI